MKTLLLNMKEVESLLSMEQVIESVSDGYRAFDRGEVQQPDIVSMEMPESNGETDIKSCYNKMNRIASVKIASGFYDNDKVNDLPTMIGTILLLDGTTGEIICIMDGSLITGIRTGAAGAVSCRLLARKDSKTVAVFGGGGQARMQVRGICAVMENIEKINVFSQYPEELFSYKTEIEKETGKQVIICQSPEEAMRDADIAVSTTPSKEYIVSADLVRPGTHIVAVGADMAGKNEWDPAIFGRAKVVNDSIAQCVARGETRNAIINGVIREEDIYGEIGTILSGRLPGRENDEEITIFDTTGMAIQDNVTAVRVYQAALEKGIGQYFEFL